MEDKDKAIINAVRDLLGIDPNNPHLEFVLVTIEIPTPGMMGGELLVYSTINKDDYKYVLHHVIQETKLNETKQ